ncbi:MAG: tetratricopeptide repeat protein [Treponema sp.]|jgi:tetratricopeptide (TPR) repeat protein|nr:tetratricopeptide repeat protein [Treponema sp.]
MMKKTALFLWLLVLALAAAPGQQKFALVIGNSAYTGITRLNNPVNDANDVSAALRGLGFTVDTLTNAGRAQMEEGVTRLKNRLTAAQGSYGFFYYAGHGVQSGGENYLIPVDANIPGEAYLQDRAVPMQAVLGELNLAGNGLNIVVLDACRDNPFSWRRSNSRGLQVVTNQPADSIIVYATSAGAAAADGTGRNGLFTTHLLNNLKTPGLSVRDLFDKTGADVRRASSGSQIPAIYSQFFETAYLGGRPGAVQPGPKPSPAPQPAPGQDAKSRFDRGELFRSRGDYVTAIEEYTQAIRLDPNYRNAYHNRGVAYENTKDYDRALADYTQAIRLDPDYRNAYIGCGNAYRNKGDYDRAIADYTQAIRLDPDYAITYYSRGLAYYHKKDYDRAIADYTQAIRLNPDYTNAYYSRGLAYNNGKKDYDRAIADYTQAIRLNPDYRNAYYSRGLAYNDKGDYDRAAADYTQAIRLDPDYTNAYYNRGLAYYHKKDYDRAIADCTQAIRLAPDYRNAYYNRGAAYYHKKDYNRAVADYEAALRIDPNHSLSKTGLENARRARGY